MGTLHLRVALALGACFRCAIAPDPKGKGDIPPEFPWMHVTQLEPLDLALRKLHEGFSGGDR